ncbi:expressed protein isoform B [Micractinium conductrix]|uniref:Expressed protein isoform B n=1 Tax=Micractinium conductrix TaxID=554055 RepID=A0A2P6V466_9CHLO|nr:expressed protein isoform C [Micractinium conductrix]PSC68881.1 expressed protein isoform B [Micractinium conductrix]|eukprot:PSC68879.1 expressed protein isoform C [Micractinium conductrix]
MVEVVLAPRAYRRSASAGEHRAPSSSMESKRSRSLDIQAGRRTGIAPSGGRDGWGSADGGGPGGTGGRHGSRWGALGGWGGWGGGAAPQDAEGSRRGGRPSGDGSRRSTFGGWFAWGSPASTTRVHGGLGTLAMLGLGRARSPASPRPLHSDGTASDSLGQDSWIRQHDDLEALAALTPRPGSPRSGTPS